MSKCKMTGRNRTVSHHLGEYLNSSYSRRFSYGNSEERPRHMPLAALRPCQSLLNWLFTVRWLSLLLYYTDGSKCNIDLIKKKMRTATFLTNRTSSVLHKRASFNQSRQEYLQTCDWRAFKKWFVTICRDVGLRDVFKSGDDPITGLRCSPIMMT